MLLEFQLYTGRNVRHSRSGQRMRLLTLSYVIKATLSEATARFGWLGKLGISYRP